MSFLTVRITRAGLLTVLILLFLAACSGQAPRRPPDVRVPLLNTRNPAGEGSETGRVLAHYRAFWPTLARASTTSPEVRRRMLDGYLAEPELSRSLEAMAAQDALGRQIYGVDRPRATVRAVTGSRAEVVDCQNSTGSGVLERGSGERLTVGVGHNPLIARLRRAPDGRWRIYRVTYTGGVC
jgi:hypothetical protein